MGFGSDFDGIEFNVKNLEGNEQYENLWNELQKYYSDIQVSKFLYGNMATRLSMEKS
ncbi:hypothetical protein JCM21738_404 [Mesobacillus boroniphilus JCM 21738]|uniref:Uncharacterized protein n=1 Tax=Mesobacillus boroniphilus JCM 21738 TaxID=1294265 RepID=W4RHX2_9BACI|nr:hypothetical protein JCM21738_404 [Mesobacillus boroniphilus JCM 21738]